jgi:site-specific DNA-methyltransferase (adenine-specific)
MGNKTEGLIKQMNVKDIQDKIEEFLPIRKIEKNKNGEVFTPYILIEEMLDKLPKEVWSNPDLKWLDPANGIGNFPMVVYNKLMKGLEKEIENEEDRKEHIIKNMLHMVELNEKNVGVSRKIFGKDANIYCGDFLKADLNKIFGIEKFDVIIGNPPYQGTG